ncbi:MAG: hypothetical protein ABIK09_00145 [Pseudomonadota bacterium]
MHRLTILALAATLLVPGRVEAKNVQGKLGFGYQLTLAGVQGFSLTYWAAEKFAMQFIAGAEFKLDKKNEVNSTIHLGIGGRYVLMSTRYANLSIGLRAVMAYAPNLWTTSSILRCHPDGDGSVCEEEISTATESNVVQFGVELPIEVEYFFSDTFSIMLGAGAMAVFVPKAGAILDPGGLGAVHQAENKGIGIGTGAVFGAAAFNFYL